MLFRSKRKVKPSVTSTGRTDTIIPDDWTATKTCAELESQSTAVEGLWWRARSFAIPSSHSTTPHPGQKTFSTNLTVTTYESSTSASFRPAADTAGPCAVCEPSHDRVSGVCGAAIPGLYYWIILEH